LSDGKGEWEENLRLNKISAAKEIEQNFRYKFVQYFAA
jgi:hypothetical protein